MKKEKGILYVLSNPAMPEMVKIGKTTGTLEDRIKQLSSRTSVPLSFECVIAKVVDDVNHYEKKMHDAFASRRVNPSREFFYIPSEELIHLFELFPGEYVNSEQNIFETKEEKIAFEKATKKGERFNFKLVGIKKGTTLYFSKDNSITCEVVSNTKVKFRNGIHSLSSAGVLAINSLGYNWTKIAGPRHWFLDGESVYDLRQRLENEE